MCTPVSIPRPNWRKDRDGYRAHNTANVRDWDISKAKKMSLDSDEPNAQFNPHLVPNLTVTEELELACIQNGIPLTSLDPAEKKHKLYMDCRTHPKFLNKKDCVIGYCSGEETPYIFVEWKCGGGFHGRPMCENELKRQGAKL
jgi:hypothetical protein